jgi:hypothetical protein
MRTLNNVYFSSFLTYTPKHVSNVSTKTRKAKEVSWLFKATEHPWRQKYP